MGRELVYRPALIAFLGLIVGISSAYSPINLVFGLLLFPLLWKSKGTWTLLISIGLGVVIRPPEVAPIVVPGGVFHGTVQVIEVPRLERDSKLYTLESHGKRYRMRLPSSADPNLGDILKLDAKIVPLKFLVGRHRLEVAELQPMGAIEVVREGFIGWKWSSHFRDSFVAYTKSVASARTAGLIEALVLNVTSDLGNSLVNDLRNTGTIHIVSASGLHAAIVVGFVALVLLFLPIPRWIQIAILFGFLFLYAAAAGFHLPMIRSVLMVFCGVLGYLFMREPDGLSSLSVSGILSLIWIPESVASVGFQLSYLVVAFLILFGSNWNFPTDKSLRVRIWASAKMLIRTGTVATIASTPILAFNMGQFPILSVLANLLIIPAVPVIVIGSLMGWCANIFWPGLAVGILKFIVEPLVSWLYAVVDTMGSWSWSIISVQPFSPLWLVFIYIALACLYQFKRRTVDDSTIW